MYEKKMYENWRVAALQKELRDRGLEARGNQDELIARLSADDQGRQAEEVESSERRPVMNGFLRTVGTIALVMIAAVFVVGLVWLMTRSTTEPVAEVNLEPLEGKVTDLGVKFEDGFEKLAGSVQQLAAEIRAPAVVQPAQAAQPEPQAITTGVMPTFVENVSHGAWNIRGTDRLKENPIVAGWLSRLKDPMPEQWRTFPNIPNPDVPEFRVVNGSEVPDGMKYGTYSTPYCWQSPCDIPVGAWEYRYISGDYNFLGQECKGDGTKGCMLVLINVMDKSYTWRGQYVDNGFTLRGRYFNGDALEWGLWGLVSHGSANMLNMPTLSHPGEVLNSGQPGNSGANCGTPAGCKSVDVTVVIHAGDRILAVAETTVSR